LGNFHSKHIISLFLGGSVVCSRAEPSPTGLNPGNGLFFANGEAVRRLISPDQNIVLSRLRLHHRANGANKADRTHIRHRLPRCSPWYPSSSRSSKPPSHPFKSYPKYDENSAPHAHQQPSLRAATTRRRPRDADGLAKHWRRVAGAAAHPRVESSKHKVSGRQGRLDW
jgi:hypothetical protein